jgi:hypothetical protein
MIESVLAEYLKSSDFWSSRLWPSTLSQALHGNFIFFVDVCFNAMLVQPLNMIRFHKFHYSRVPYKKSGYCFIWLILTPYLSYLSPKVIPLSGFHYTWANGHLWITATWQQRPPIWRPNYKLCSITYLWTTASILGSQGWPLYTGLTVVQIFPISSFLILFYPT